MWQDFFSSLSSWGAVLLAFVPPAVIAVVLARFSSRIDRSNDNLMTSVLRVSGSALVFITAFTIATVWQQASAYVNEVHTEYSAARTLARAASLELPADKAEAVASALDGYLSVAADVEFAQPLSPTEPPPAQEAFEQAVSEIVQALPAEGAATTATSGLKAASTQTRLDELISARDARVDRNNQPGVPLVVALAVMILSWIVVALLALYPGTQGWVKALHVSVSVTVVGLIQLPLYYLGSNDSTRDLLGYMIRG